MKKISDPKKFQQVMERLRASGKTIGFVPTMGALHEGHLSLVRASRKENDVTVASIFVNPTQFGPNEDLAKYPRPLQKDLALLAKEKNDFVFLPTPEAMYGKGEQTWVEVPESLTKGLCGAFRPGHFRGVATVVAKLFHLALPHRAYFGAKDFQQTAVIRKMIGDLNFNVELKVMPTVREKDGLAMSSRNAYLSAEERKRALVLSNVLFGIRDQIGKRALSIIKQEALARLKKETDRVDYLEIVDSETLEPVTKVQPRMVALAACYVGKTRLIDNVIIAAQKKG